MKNWNNFIDYPVSRTHAPVKMPKTRNCCGMAATGDGTATSDSTVKAAVRKINAISMAKTALALVGVFVVGKYILGKLK